MPIRIHIPTPLRRMTGGAKEVSVTAATAGEAIEALVSKHPDLRSSLFDEAGGLRNYVSVFLGDEDIRRKNGLATPVPDGATLLLVPSIAGGNVDLSPAELKRYSRHIILPEVGLEGQKKLKASSILLIGAGGLGSPLGMYLAAAGIGRLGIVDMDRVDESNLQRQVIHGTKDIGRPKLDSAKERIHDINPHVQVDAYDTAFRAENAMKIAAPYDIIIDGTDNFPTRYLTNDVSVFLGKPNVYGSIFRFEGHASVFAPKLGGPCYRCLYPEPPPPGMVPSCAEGGVLGILPGIIGLIQANEAVKLILGIGDSLVGRFLLFDALSMEFRELKIRRRPECPVCGDHPTITAPIDYDQFCGVPNAADAAKEAGMIPTVKVEDLKARMDKGDKDFVLLDVREPNEFAIANLGGKLIPLGEIPQRFGELDANREMIVHCKMGGRSAKAVEFLRAHGFKNVWNLEGGINAWSARIDPKVPTY